MRISDWSSDVCSSDLITELDLNLDASIEDRMIRQSISIPTGAVTTVGPPHIFTEQDAATSPFDPAPEGGAAKGVEAQLVQNPGALAANLFLPESTFLAKPGLGASTDRQEERRDGKAGVRTCNTRRA